MCVYWTNRVKFIKIHAVGTELFHADGQTTGGRRDRQTDRNEKAKSRFRNFSNPLKN